MLIEKSLETLKKAKEYCLNNHLHFLIPSINQTEKYYLFFEEALSIFPAEKIIDEKFSVPKKYCDSNKKRIDFYVIIEFLKKLEKERFPSESFITNIKSILRESDRFIKKIYKFLGQYLSGLQAKKNVNKYKFSRKDIEEELDNYEKNSLINFEPEVMEMKIIIR